MEQQDEIRLEETTSVPEPSRVERWKSFLGQLGMEKILLAGVPADSVLQLLNSVALEQQRMSTTDPATAYTQAHSKAKKIWALWISQTPNPQSKEKTWMWKAKIKGNPLLAKKVKLGVFHDRNVDGGGADGGNAGGEPEPDSGDKNSIPLGKHMSVQLKTYTGKEPLTLDDGTVVKPGDPIGELHFIRNLPKLKPGDSITGFIREGFSDAEQALKELSQLVAGADPRLTEVNVFFGVSHLASRLAKRLGFEVYSTDQLPRLINKVMNKMYFRIAQGVAGNNPEWQKLSTNFKPAGFALLTRNSLIEQYGTVPAT